MAAVGDPDFLTDTAVLIALALEVVPERDLRVDEDGGSHIFAFLRGLCRQISRSTALLKHALKGIATVTVIRRRVLHLDTSVLELDCDSMS